jgi:hypothetical protein
VPPPRKEVTLLRKNARNSVKPVAIPAPAAAVSGNPNNAWENTSCHKLTIVGFAPPPEKQSDPAMELEEFYECDQKEFGR